MLFSLGAVLLAAVVAGQPLETRVSDVSYSNSGSSLTLLYQNNLNASDDINHVGAILLDPVPAAQAAAGCAAVNEQLLSKATLKNHSTDFVDALSYQAFAGRAAPVQAYQIAKGVVVVTKGSPHLVFAAYPVHAMSLPVLCTQSANTGYSGNSNATAQNEVSIASNGNTFVGYRNQKSFRFLGIPFANQPERFQYSEVYSETGQTIQATAYGSECAQAGAGSEDCLFINVQTPYIPKAGSTKNLRPVHYWIYGGGFTGGTGSDPTSDGGNLASREDIVTVQVNYRLSTLGFLAIPGTNITGNYGIGDQITGLEWTITNIAQFGGDPNQITINGESAGAGSVRTLLGSPPAIGKFQGAIAMSNLGGGQDLGLTSNYGTTYSIYLTIDESYAIAGQQIFSEVGCNQTSLDAQIACLTAAPAQTIVSANTVARYVVIDGYIVNTQDLDVVNKNGSAAHVPCMFGNVANDGASFSTYPTTPVANETQGLMEGLSISEAYAQDIINSGLFPFYDTGNLTLDSFNVTQRVATDNTFRCIDQATMYAGTTSGAFPVTYYYQMDRTVSGYNPNNVPANGPVEPGYPNGDPNLPYFRLHGSDMSWVFGTLTTLRDANDLYSIQLISGYFAQFVKNGQPNPSEAYLKVRNYATTLENVEKYGTWDPVSSDTGPMRLLDYPSVAAEFQDLPQCAFLNYSISYYLDGGV